MSFVRWSTERAMYYASSNGIAGPHSYEVTQGSTVQNFERWCILYRSSTRYEHSWPHKQNNNALYIRFYHVVIKTNER
jgi:hypothetical protein